MKDDIPSSVFNDFLLPRLRLVPPIEPADLTDAIQDKKINTNGIDEYVVSFPVPGIEKQDLKVEVSNSLFRAIVVRGKTETSVRKYMVNYRKSLSDDIDADSAVCSLNNGVLYVTFRYKQRTEKTKLIPIN